MSDSELRIGDAERDAAVSALGEHYAEGRLTKEEYDERSGRAWSAGTNADLWPLFTDLPAARTPRSPSVRPAAPGPAKARADRWWRALPLLPVLAVIGALVVLTHMPWPLFLVLGLLWWSGFFRGGHSRRR